MSEDQKVYARVVDGAIIEYPVLGLHIRNRAHPLDWYSPVVFIKKPEFDQATEYLQEITRIAGNHVVAEYVVKTLSVDNILNKLFYPNGMRFDPLNPTKQVEPADIKISDLDQAFIAKVMDIVSREVGNLLDAFARTRQYDDVKSCATYATSANTQFKAEADRIVALRDQTYAALYAYITEVMSGAKPVPKSFAEIKAVLPELTWE